MANTHTAVIKDGKYWCACGSEMIWAHTAAEEISPTHLLCWDSWQTTPADDAVTVTT